MALFRVRLFKVVRDLLILNLVVFVLNGLADLALKN